jgi:uncharacterized protein
MKRLVIKAVQGYKRLISPMLPPACRYIPTCSEYAVEAVERFGVVRGGLMAIWRVLRCNPFVKGGVDPVEHRCGSETRHAASLRGGVSVSHSAGQ